MCVSLKVNDMFCFYNMDEADKVEYGDRRGQRLTACVICRRQSLYMWLG